MTNEFHPGKPVGRRFAIGSLGMLGLAACTPAVGPAGPPAGGNSLAAALEADPRFSTFVWLIKEQGMWQTLRDAPKQYTIFAPTNEAYGKLPQGWKADTFPSTGGPNGGYDNRARIIGLLRMHFVSGSYPPSVFIGRTQPVMTLAGTQFIADGTQPGTIILRLKPSLETGVGFPDPKVTHAEANVLMPPIETAGGVIYPVDTVLLT